MKKVIYLLTAVLSVGIALFFVGNASAQTSKPKSLADFIRRGNIVTTTYRPDAEAGCYLGNGRWKTHVKQSIDRKGNVRLRGHLGSYKVRVTYRNEVKEVDCHLEKDGKNLLITL